MIFDRLRDALGRAGLLFAVVAALTLPSDGARSQTRKDSFFASGNALLDACNNDASWCAGYIVGIADAVTLVQANGGTIDARRACVPGEAMQSQVRDAVVNFLRTHPEWRHFSAPALVARALVVAFPCR